jgi:hypothetical protein
MNEDDKREYEAKKEILLKEIKNKWNRVLTHDKQIDSIKNWCIVTLTGLISFIIYQINSDKIKNLLINVENKVLYNEFSDSGNIIIDNPIILFLPILVILFFALHELIKQFWKMEALQELCNINNKLNINKQKNGKYNGTNLCLPQNMLNIKFSIVSEEIKGKFKNREEAFKNNKNEEKSYFWNLMITSILAWNFALFYGLLLALYSVITFYFYLEFFSFPEYWLLLMLFSLSIIWIACAILDFIGIINTKIKWFRQQKKRKKIIYIGFFIIVLLGIIDLVLFFIKGKSFLGLIINFLKRCFILQFN